MGVTKQIKAGDRHACPSIHGFVYGETAANESTYCELESATKEMEVFNKFILQSMWVYEYSSLERKRVHMGF